jgi:hypothetical protein
MLETFLTAISLSLSMAVNAATEATTYDLYVPNYQGSFTFDGGVVTNILVQSSRFGNAIAGVDGMFGLGIIALLTLFLVSILCD